MSRKFKICIDPGHPSYFRGKKEINWGARIGKFKEVEINLELARILKELLKRESFSCVLTRQDNIKVVSNKQRAIIAKDFGAQLFLRIHIDWERHNDPNIRGIKTIYPPPSAEKIHKISWEIALVIHKEIIKKTGLIDRGVCDERITFYKDKNGMLEGTFWANKFNIPTVLLELGYLSNPEDREWISLEENKRKLMEAVAEGIKKVGYTYFEKSL